MGGFMLGEKLKAARRRAGLSLRELQERIGNKVTAQAIGKYERGKMQPSTDILISLASALGTSEKYFISSTAIQLGEIEFRENFIRSKKDQDQVKAIILKRVENYIEVEELLQVKTTEWDQPRDFPFVVRDVKDVELAAYKIRDDWKLSDDPIPHLAEFFEDRGIKVVSLSLPESIAGVTCFIHREHYNSIPAIVINKGITGERQRFTLAHELGHLVLDNKSKLDNENICNRFASAFHMPERTLWAVLGKHRHSISLGELKSLKKYFGLSVQAIVYRCKDLRIINYKTYQNLYREFAQRGWLKPPYPEPELIDHEETHRFKRLCFRALSEEIISKEKAAELLNMTSDQINDEMDFV